MKRLNLGCGSNIRKGWINLDISKLPGVDVIHDLEKLPLPFKDEEFDYILCQDVLEHVEYIPLLKDLHRILKKEGILEIRVPHFTSKNNFIDPTHKKFFSIQTFDFFVKNFRKGREYYFDFHFNKIISSKITFDKGLLFYNYPVELLINCSNKMKRFFEASFLSRMFPAENIIVEIKR